MDTVSPALAARSAVPTAPLLARPLTPGESAHLDRLRAWLVEDGTDSHDTASLDDRWERLLATHPADAPAPAGVAAALGIAIGDVLVTRVPDAVWMMCPGPEGATPGVLVPDRPHMPVLTVLDAHQRWRVRSPRWADDYVRRAAAHLLAGRQGAATPLTSSVVPSPAPPIGDERVLAPAEAGPAEDTPAADTRDDEARDDQARDDQARDDEARDDEARDDGAWSGDAAPHAVEPEVGTSEGAPDALSADVARADVTLADVGPVTTPTWMAPVPELARDAVSPALPHRRPAEHHAAPLTPAVGGTGASHLATPGRGLPVTAHQHLTPEDLPHRPSERVQDLALRALEIALDRAVADPAGCAPFVLVREDHDVEVLDFPYSTSGLAQAREAARSGGYTGAAVAWTSPADADRPHPRVVVDASAPGRPGIRVAHSYAHDEDGGHEIGGPQVVGQSAPVL